MVFMCNLDENEVQRSYEEVIKHKVWRDSVGDEKDAMISIDTWYESDYLKGRRLCQVNGFSQSSILQMGRLISARLGW